MIRYVSIERSAAEIDQAATSPPTNVGTRRRPRSSIGSSWKSSAATKTRSRTALAASAAMTPAEPQPSVWLSISP